MTGAYISRELRRVIGETAHHRCGYCLHPEELLGMPLTIDHLIPQAVGGQTEEQNLWLACPSCNQFKGIQTFALHKSGDKMVRLFDPRRQPWHQHFEWSKDGSRIIGRTACGRATTEALQLNNPQAVVARRLWVSVGWWPPHD